MVVSNLLDRIKASSKNLKGMEFGSRIHSMLLEGARQIDNGKRWSTAVEGSNFKAIFVTVEAQESERRGRERIRGGSNFGKEVGIFL
ncbi:hypothetical protein V6N12_016065 [Hibiscus sabdariffa]|uniref:Uncharacterized protein n=1 Tax=Hibiscus sabdariffa TaxID=183260 RepID=A0ABR2ALY5_9ROSI